MSKKEEFYCDGECEECIFNGACDELTRREPGCAIAVLLFLFFIVVLFGIGCFIAWIISSLM